LKEGPINLVALRALMEVMVYLWEKLLYIFSLYLKIDVARKHVEKFRAQHFFVLDGKDAAE
jgi:hypothetical protein